MTMKIYERLFIGTDDECFTKRDGWVTVHACKSPCHQNAVGYRGSLPSNHPYYLVMETENNLYLNMIDPPGPLFMMPLFTRFLKFTSHHWNNRQNVLIHCNKGESRAPSLALLFLAKNIEIINNESYKMAKQEFMNIYPYYTPGTGIQIYLEKNWEKILR